MQHIFIRQRQNKQAKVSRQKQGYQRQGRDVSGQVQSIRQSGVNTEIRIRRMGKRSEMSAGARNKTSQRVGESPELM